MSENSTTQSASILAVDDDPIQLQILSVSLRKEGYEVITADRGEEALLRVQEATPDLIISDVMMPGLDGFELLRQLRSNKSTASIPVIMLTTRNTNQDIIDGLTLGADDYLAKPFNTDVLLAKVRSKLTRPPIPVENLDIDRQTGFHSLQDFIHEASREIIRASKGGKPGCLAYLEILETSRYRERLGSLADREIVKQISGLIHSDDHPLDIIGYDPGGKFLLLMPEIDQESSKKYLTQLINELSSHNYQARGENLHLTPIVGYSIFSKEGDYAVISGKAQIALEYSRAQMDLQPKLYNAEANAYIQKQRDRDAAKVNPQSKPSLIRNWRTIIQVAAAIILAFFLPLGFYLAFDKWLIDITPFIYIVIVISLLVTAIMIWIEGIVSLKDIDPTFDPELKYPPASAILAAYLPNEAYTILDTIKRFLSLDYPGGLQIILAYNTPQNLPVEDILRSIAKEDPRLVLLRVEGSQSKSQNVNAAITHVTGNFVGIFDADHQPAANAFSRAWQWLSSGYDIVQGHCLVRNYDASRLAKMVSVEFEAIYAVSHPGRTRLYGFGIFGGSNGFWKTELLRQTRMHGFMLTEDIDSSMRVTETGSRIATDPRLLSRELAPVTLKALWNQRMRWSQGWFQVSLEHFLYAIRSKNLTIRQKIGAAYILAWREIYPWLSTQMFPVIAFWIIKYHGVNKLDWLIPIFIMTTVFTLSVGPGQAILAYIKSDEEIKVHKSWFFWYLIFSSIFYTEFKNTISRIAQIKEIMGERSWRITPRSKDKPGA